MMGLTLRLLALLVFICAMSASTPQAFAQDEDLDLESQETGDFDNLEQELEQADAPAQNAPSQAPAPDAATPDATTNAVGDDLDLEEEAQAQKPLPADDELDLDEEPAEVPPVV